MSCSKGLASDTQFSGVKEPLNLSTSASQVADSPSAPPVPRFWQRQPRDRKSLVTQVDACRLLKSCCQEPPAYFCFCGVLPECL